MTPKQQRFVEEYCVDWNATQAAIRAGYSEKTANEIGAQNLAKLSIAQAIEARRAEISEELGITEREIVNGLRLEAQRTGEGSSHSARVTAWSWLGKYRRMFEDDGSNRNASQPVTVNINILNNA